MNRKIQTNHGVTLMELLILSVIVGIIAAMAVPRFQIAFDRIKFRSVNRDLSSTVRLARSYAISNKEQYGLCIDGNQMTITLFKDVVNLGGLTYESGDSVLRVDTLPQEYTYLGTDCNNDVIMFQPNGSASFTGGGSIFTTAYTDHVVAIHSNSVLASTGRISTEAYYY